MSSAAKEEKNKKSDGEKRLAGLRAKKERRELWGEEGREGGAEGDLPADALEELLDSVLDLLVTLLGPHDGLRIHLVDDDDHLLDTEGEGEKSVLTGLSLLVTEGV